MTVKELSKLYGLNKGIPIELERIAELEAKASRPSSPNYTGMPHATGYYQSKLENQIVELEHRREMLDGMIVRRDSLQQFIDDIPDSYTRYLFMLRFVNNMSWKEIAMAAGGRNTEESVKKRCYRYLKGCEENEPDERTPTEV